MNAKSKLPAWPAASSSPRLSDAGRSFSTILSATPAVAQWRRAMAVNSSLTSNANTRPSGPMALATAMAL